LGCFMAVVDVRKARLLDGWSRGRRQGECGIPLQLCRLVDIELTLGSSDASMKRSLKELPHSLHRGE
jgi:hypothetical protein